jgi:hypothetical protein
MKYLSMRWLLVFLAIGSLTACQQFQSKLYSERYATASPHLAVRTPSPQTGLDELTDPNTAAVVEKALKWLVAAQAENGGWGAGLHSAQQIRDPHSVAQDPATTAFAAMALLRSGNSLQEGAYSENLERALNYLLEVVENSTGSATNITDQTGTQIQRKLGQNIDASMTSRFFTRILPQVAANADLSQRVNKALDICLEKVKNSVNDQGQVSGGSWAGVLQEAMAGSALEEVVVMRGDSISPKNEQIQARQLSKMSSTGAVNTDDAAGVSLYSYSTVTRTTAKDAQKAQRALKKARDKGEFSEVKSGQAVPVTIDNLKKAGLADEEAERLENTYRVNTAARNQAQSDDVLKGFGNNGGEEFLSQLMTSEAMVMTGGEEWEAWQEKIGQLLTRIQNPDGSYSGHHCITSPAFCTAAVIQTLTVELDETLQMNDDE